jgi:hypothetical protein
MDTVERRKMCAGNSTPVLCHSAHSLVANWLSYLGPVNEHRQFPMFLVRKLQKLGHGILMTCNKKAPKHYPYHLNLTLVSCDVCVCPSDDVRAKN